MKNTMIWLAALGLLAAVVPAQSVGGNGKTLFGAAGAPPPLEIDKDFIVASIGGTVEFSLCAGGTHAGRAYAIFGSASGSMPGTPLPGGLVVLPVNWDVFTSMLLSLNPPGFMGALDQNGEAFAPLAIPPFQLSPEIPLTFAYALQGPPWDFASNPVELCLKGDSKEYRYDDGSTEGLSGWTVGGDICRMHWFQAKGGADTIQAVAVAWGSKLLPGGCPGNGTPSTVFIWDDPTDDGDPVDCVFLAKKDTVVQNVDTDLLSVIELDAPVTVSGVFFIGCVLDYPAGQYVMGLDFDNTSCYQAWIGGNMSGKFDYMNLGNNTLYELAGIGLFGCFLLRAIN